VGKKIHDNKKNSLPLKHYLIFVFPSIVPSKLDGIITLKCLSNHSRVGASEIDYK